MSAPDDKYTTASERLEDLEAIAVLADELGVTESQLRNWASRRNKNGFPEPAISLGKYQLFDRIEVHNWFGLWKKVNKRLGHKEGLRNQNG